MSDLSWPVNVTPPAPIPKITYGSGYALEWTPDVPVSADSYNLPVPKRIRVEADSGAHQVIRYGSETPPRQRTVEFAWLPLSKALAEFEEVAGESFEAFYLSAGVADFRYYPDRDANEYMRASLVSPITDDEWAPARRNASTPLYSFRIIMREFVGDEGS